MAKVTRTEEESLQEIILGIFEEVLRVSDLKSDSNFFQEGGHSLLVIRVVSRLFKRLQIKLSVRALFENPTAEELAAHIIGLRD